MLAEGLEKALMTKGKLNIEQINFPLVILLEALLAEEEKLEICQEKGQA